MGHIWALEQRKEEKLILRIELRELVEVCPRCLLPHTPAPIIPVALLQRSVNTDVSG